MNGVLVILAATAGGWLGWYAGAQFGTMTAFIASIVGTAAGVYLARRLAAHYLP